MSFANVELFAMIRPRLNTHLPKPLMKRVPSPDGRENPFVPVPRLREAQKIGRTAGIAP